MFLIERLDALVEQGRRFPGTNAVMVDKVAATDLIEQLRVAVPEEVRQAKRINEESSRLVERAQDEAERVIARAQEQDWKPASGRWMSNPLLLKARSGDPSGLKRANTISESVFPNFCASSRQRVAMTTIFPSRWMARSMNNG
jgi:hypothetical protein